MAAGVALAEADGRRDERAGQSHKKYCPGEWVLELRPLGQSGLDSVRSEGEGPLRFKHRPARGCAWSIHARLS